MTNVSLSAWPGSSICPEILNSRRRNEEFERSFVFMHSLGFVGVSVKSFISFVCFVVSIFLRTSASFDSKVFISDCYFAFNLSIPSLMRLAR